MIENIYIDLLKAHPKNPRIDLGDLTELAESIKESGIMQNLTVVRDDSEQEGYTVIIGHRRLEAARMAGLEELPCNVVEMDEKTQVATMLLENVQREDLTPYEQAHGFQMMIDLGETVDTISKKTGLSQTTVRHRVKLLELDQETLAEKSKQQITLTDLQMLEKIKSPEKKNDCLEYIGTKDFDWKVSRAVEEEKREEFEEKLGEAFEREYLPIIYDDEQEDYDPTEDMYFLKTYYTYTLKGIEEIDKLIEEAKEEYPEAKYFEMRYGNIHLYRDRVPEDDEEDEDDEMTPEEIEAERKREIRKSIFKAIEEKTENFIKDITDRKAEENAQLIMKYASIVMIGSSAGGWGVNPWIRNEEYAEILGCEVDEITGEILDHPGKSILKILYLKLIPGSAPSFYNGQYNESIGEKLIKLYEMLEALGYVTSEEERSFIEGTHESYEAPEKEEENDELKVEDEEDEEGSFDGFEEADETEYDDNYFDERD